nr:unnamed protein product [Digitaria exilis]
MSKFGLADRGGYGGGGAGTEGGRALENSKGIALILSDDPRATAAAAAEQR